MKKREPKIVACDMDHTLSAAWHRDHLIPEWDKYYVDQEADPPIWEWIEIVRGLSAIGYKIIGLTAREEQYRAATTRWLVKHDVPIDEILMRPRGDFRASPALKIGVLQQAYPGFHGIKMVIEDRQDVAEAFRSMGVTVVLATAHPRFPEKSR